MRAQWQTVVLFWAWLMCLLKVSVSNQIQNECSSLVDAFEKKYEAVPVSTHGDRPDDVNPFVFFLHVPRTAGKTYSTCFLSPAVPPSQTCLPGYDRYRLQQSPLGCRYYTSHDDLSLVDQLSEENRKRVEVVTQIRDPVSRVLSAYEFPIEVASRKVNEPMSNIEKSKANLTTVNTYNVWPWKYLILHARDGMQDRLDAINEKGVPPVWTEHIDPQTNRTFYYNKATNKSEWERPHPLNALDPYENELTIPLREWIELPEVEDLVHNGHTLQLLGITNTSFWEEAGALRRCFFQDEASRERMFELAKNKLRKMPHAGLQERLDDSVASLASSLGLKMSDKAYKGVQMWSYLFDDVENLPDLDATVTYSLSGSEGGDKGEAQTITLREARYKLYRLEERLRDINAKLKKSEPRLRALLKREDKWMDRMELERSQSTYWKLRKALIAPVISRVKWLGYAARCAITGRLDELEDFDWYDDQDEEELLKASPFAKNITSLDEVVAKHQNERDEIIDELVALKELEGVSGVPWGENTRVFIPFDDDFKLHKDRDLGTGYSTCSRDAYRKGKRGRSKPMMHLRNERDEGFQFTSEARKIYLEKNKDVLDRIRELNSVDERLLKFAAELFNETLRQQSAAGALEDIPEPLPPKSGSNEDTTEGKGRKVDGGDGREGSKGDKNATHTEL